MRAYFRLAVLVQDGHSVVSVIGVAVCSNLVANSRAPMAIRYILGPEKELSCPGRRTLVRRTLQRNKLLNKSKNKHDWSETLVMGMRKSKAVVACSNQRNEITYLRRRR